MAGGESHCVGHRARLREKFQRSGFESLLEYEAVELLLTLVIPRSDVKQPAKALIARFGNLRGILDAPIDVKDRTGAVVLGPFSRELRFEGVSFAYDGNGMIGFGPRPKQGKLRVSLFCGSSPVT